MTLKIYLVFFVVLAAAVIIAVMARNGPEVHPTTLELPSGKPPVSTSEEEAPSKENASQNIKDAIAHLTELAEKDPTNAATLFELARLLQNAHRPAEALQYYEKGLLVTPRNTDARVDYSLCLFEIGRVQNALEQNRIVLRHKPGSAKALYNIGAVHANTGLRDSAEYYWTRLMSIHPDDELSSQARANIDKLHEKSAER